MLSLTASWCRCWAHLGTQTKVTITTMQKQTMVLRVSLDFQHPHKWLKSLRPQIWSSSSAKWTLGQSCRERWPPGRVAWLLVCRGTSHCWMVFLQMLLALPDWTFSFSPQSQTIAGGQQKWLRTSLATPHSGITHPAFLTSSSSF